MELNKISTGEVPILIYSHSSYSDVWPLIFGQFEKYFSNSKIYLLTDEDPIQIKYPKISIAKVYIRKYTINSMDLIH